MLPNRSFHRSVQSLVLALLGAIALSALVVGSASADVSPDQAFGKGGVAWLQPAPPLDDYEWDAGTALRDGSVAFVASRRYTTEVRRQPVIRIIRANGTIDRNLGPSYRIPFPGWTRAYRVHRHAPSAFSRQSDGKLLVAGNALVPRQAESKRCGCRMYREGWYVLRLLKSGKRDQSFGRNGVAVVSEGKTRTRSYIPVSLAKSIEVDRRGGILLHGSDFEGRSPTVLVRLRPDGDRDRQFRRISGGEFEQLRMTGSGEIVLVRAVIRDVGQYGRYGLGATIRRFSPSGVSRGTQRVPLPGVGYTPQCGGRCGGFTPGLQAEVFPSGAVLLVGGFGESGLSSTWLTMVSANGEIDKNFGSEGHLMLPKPYDNIGAFEALSPRPNGEIWAVLPGVSEKRLLRIAPGGDIIRPPDQAIGTRIPGSMRRYGGGRFAFVGPSLLESYFALDPSSVDRRLIVRRWNLKF